MKFAHEFKEALQRGGFPEHWVESAVPYGQLKKLLKKVQQELSDLGLDRETMRQLLTAHRTPSAVGPIAMAKYHLDPNDSRLLRPRLTVYVHLKDGVAVDASLSPASRDFVKELVSKASLTQDDPSTGTKFVEHDDIVGNELARLPALSTAADPSLPIREQPLQRIEVPLVFDGEFFQILQNDVASLDALQREQQESMEAEILDLGQEVSEVARPSKFSKSDLSRWREIFELYVDARIFFSTQELDHGARTSDVAVKQLVWFQSEVQRRGLLSKFKLPASKSTYQHFLALNATLLRSLEFQEINKRAVAKILKKFDKRTSLGVSKDFRSVVRSDSFMSDTIAKNICARMVTEVVSVVPKIDDYLCPICFSIAWLPVRLVCHHVFCIRCIIKMQRERKRFCPLCRANVVMEADITNLDENLIKFLERWFRKETKEKQKANEIERGKELFGDSYQHTSCSMM
ncbi:hypothetical protein VTK73DRAFT_4388 [Phialemonium thermophilum]|uniref:RING-14 protein n=1 Tax=Phialemonium thermophilum TaxID=223376 RepID=A0ABR3Y0H3_9PEZI